MNELFYVWIEQSRSLELLFYGHCFASMVTGTQRQSKQGQVSFWSPLPAREASSLPQKWESRSPSAPHQLGWQRWADRSRDAQRCPRTWVSIDQHGASKRAVIGPDQKKKGAQPPLKNGFIFHSLGEPLVGEEHRQTVPNVLLAAVFPSLPSHQRDHADRL